MADDQTNPYTTMGMMGMMMPNPYTAYNKALPMPGFRGTPTDAQGNPIQSYLDAQTASSAAGPAAAAPGTTLNSMGPNAPWNAGSPAYWAQKGTEIQDTASNPRGAGYAGGFGSGNSGPIWNSGRGEEMVNTLTNLEAARRNWDQPQAGSQAATGGGGPDMRQAYLDALSNPGKVTTPGATVPQSSPLGQPSVLDAFLANHPGGGQGAGNYSNQGFFNTLNQLRSAPSTAAAPAAATSTPSILAAPAAAAPAAAAPPSILAVPAAAPAAAATPAAAMPSPMRQTQYGPLSMDAINRLRYGAPGAPSAMPSGAFPGNIFNSGGGMGSSAP